MGRFIRRRNVKRYRRLLKRTTNESDRQAMLKLLCEERQKQKRCPGYIHPLAQASGPLSIRSWHFLNGPAMA
jgi:hypothetical protein